MSLISNGSISHNIFIKNNNFLKEIYKERSTFKTLFKKTTDLLN